MSVTGAILRRLRELHAWRVAGWGGAGPLLLPPQAHLADGTLPSHTHSPPGCFLSSFFQRVQDELIHIFVATVPVLLDSLFKVGGAAGNFFGDIFGVDLFVGLVGEVAVGSSWRGCVR